MDKKTIIVGVVAVAAIIWAIVAQSQLSKARAEAEAAKAQATEAQAKIDAAGQSTAAAEKMAADSKMMAEEWKSKVDKELEVISALAQKDAKCASCPAILDAVKRAQQ